MEGDGIEHGDPEKTMDEFASVIAHFCRMS